MESDQSGEFVCGYYSLTLNLPDFSSCFLGDPQWRCERSTIKYGKEYQVKYAYLKVKG